MKEKTVFLSVVAFAGIIAAFCIGITATTNAITERNSHVPAPPLDGLNQSSEGVRDMADTSVTTHPITIPPSPSWEDAGPYAPAPSPTWVTSESDASKKEEPAGSNQEHSPGGSSLQEEPHRTPNLFDLFH